MYILIDESLCYLFCRLKLLAEKLEPNQPIKIKQIVSKVLSELVQVLLTHSKNIICGLAWHITCHTLICYSVKRRKEIIRVLNRTCFPTNIIKLLAFACTYIIFILAWLWVGVLYCIYFNTTYLWNMEGVFSFYAVLKFIFPLIMIMTGVDMSTAQVII